MTDDEEEDDQVEALVAQPNAARAAAVTEKIVERVVERIVEHRVREREKMPVVIDQIASLTDVGAYALHEQLSMNK